MKKNLIISVILVIVILITSVSSVYAIDGLAPDKNFSGVSSEKHIHGENCIYSCDQNTINFSASPEVNYSHIDHENSDNCLYSCNHSINNHVASNGKITLSNEPLDKKELNDLLDKLSGVKTNSLEQAKKALFDQRGLSIDPVGPLTDSDLKELIDEFTGIQTTSFEDSKKALAKKLNVSVEELNAKAGVSSLYCLFSGHNIYNLGCQNEHSLPDEECVVKCYQTLICYWGDVECGWNDIIEVDEIVHSWSVGWCGQTCKNCGIIQLFHAPGGCSHCD